MGHPTSITLARGLERIGYLVEGVRLPVELPRGYRGHESNRPP